MGIAIDSSVHQKLHQYAWNDQYEGRYLQEPLDIAVINTAIPTRLGASLFSWPEYINVGPLVSSFQQSYSILFIYFFAQNPKITIS